MKSYEDHLRTLLSKEASNECHRASAIFPVFFDRDTTMKLLFLNYWKLKRNIDHLLCRFYLRDRLGETLLKKCFYVDMTRSYEISLTEILGRRVPFAGSLEVEFCSPENLLFPYPATVVHYSGQNFSTFVHSAQRTFNDDMDEKSNARVEPVEAGFNIYATDDRYPFITYVNGSKAVKKDTVELAAYNHEGKVIGSRINLSLKPYETTYISLDYWKELKEHLAGRVGTMKLKLPSASVFPRVVVGNKEVKSASMSVTHTYYDLVQKNKESDFWSPPNENWQAAALMLPLKRVDSFLTKVYFYPIYSPMPFSVNLEIYELDGTLLETHPDVLSFSEPKFTYLDLSEYTKGLDPTKDYSLKLIAHSESGKIPARIKIGLDVESVKGGLPCNICTNFYPANLSLEKKKSAFRWAPLMVDKGSIWCHNDAPKTSYKREANLFLTFYRKSNDVKIVRHITVEPRGSIVIERDKELERFFEGDIGWCTLESDNPYVTTYYFSEHASGMIGGDHGF